MDFTNINIANNSDKTSQDMKFIINNDILSPQKEQKPLPATPAPIKTPTETLLKRDKATKTSRKRKWLTDNELKTLSDLLKGEAQIILQITSGTGVKYSKIAKSRWHSFNKTTGTLILNGVARKLPNETVNLLLALRENAKSENDLIFKLIYKKCWEKLSRVYYKAGICQKLGCFKLLKWSFARRHFTIHRSKTKLAEAMGLRTVRWLPKEIFNITNPSPCLVQF